MEIIFKGEKLRISKGQYPNKRLALRLTDGEGFSWGVATINLPDVPLEEGEIIIKNYSEGEGMLECLRKHGVVSTPIKFVRTGYVEVPVVKLLIEI